jgi:hypothetical protein
MMTTNSTLWALLMTPLALHLYGTGSCRRARSCRSRSPTSSSRWRSCSCPWRWPWWIRRYSPNVGAVMELMGGFFGLFFIVFLMVTWVPRNWRAARHHAWQVYLVAVFLGLLGITIAYLIARAIKLHPMNARTVGLETGIQNGPLAIAIVLLSFPGSPQLGVAAARAGAVLAVHRDRGDRRHVLLPPRQPRRGAEDPEPALKRDRPEPRPRFGLCGPRADHTVARRSRG